MDLGSKIRRWLDHQEPEQLLERGSSYEVRAGWGVRFPGARLRARALLCSLPKGGGGEQPGHALSLLLEAPLVLEDGSRWWDAAASS